MGIVSVAASGLNRLRSLRHDDIDVRLDQLGDERRQPIEFSLCIANLEGHVAVLDPAELVERLRERRDAAQPLGVPRRDSEEDTDPSRPRGLLRAQRRRPKH
jgi:hypothetical protein